MSRALSIGIALFLLAPLMASAQSAEQVAARQRELQQQLDQVEQQIAAQQKLLDVAAGEHRTLQSQIDAFNAQIKKTELQIKAIDLSIQKLNAGISTSNKTLAALSQKRINEQESLAEIMRKTQILDDYSIVTVALSSETISTFFKDLDAFVAIKGSLADSFDEIQKTSSSTEAAKQTLQGKLTEEQELKIEQNLAKQTLLTQQTAKAKLLADTKGIEANYQALIAGNKKTAAQIRTELFALAGGGGQIPLPTAITLAKQAGAATGVRPAFILGVLKQETNLGANVGQCLLTNNPIKGDGKGKNTGTFFSGVMKPTRDVDPFMAITGALGLDPYAMPVSCPPSYGYGGAMGPAQFIPSTWVLYQDRVAKLAGHASTPANPWNNLDAFTATALYMSYLGASAQTPAAERLAALKYFAGANYTKPAYAFYGDGVMGFTDTFQQQINILNGS
ncbi:MAG TPA: hypothetical protein VM103_02150 [Candidatus Paceibacterota bacterium]|nr:hypothetical protein [Candidatus Paceibacterota bacterium]